MALTVRLEFALNLICPGGDGPLSRTNSVKLRSQVPHRGDLPANQR